jgi:AcrR family transcriptional regulator
MAGEESRDQQRQRLLDGLAESIKEKGLVDTQVSDIVRLAKASRRTFYNHFPDKESCYVELIDSLTDDVIERLETVTDRSRPALGQVDQAIDGYMEILLAEPELASAYWLPAQDARVVGAQRKGYERVSSFIHSVVEQDRELDPDFKPISEDRIYMLVVGFHQTMMRAHAAGRDLNAVAADLKPVLRASLTQAQAPAGA